MSSSNPPAGGQTVAPRIRVLVEGAPVDLALSIETTESNTFHAGRFNATFAPQQGSGTGSVSWWGRQTGLTVRLQVMLPQPDAGAAASPTWQDLMTGQMDRVAFDADAWQIKVSGRDLAARLIDSRTAITHLNRTASEIVTSIAQAHALAADVQATTGLVEQYYQHDHTLMRVHQHHRLPTDWDVVVALARLEGMDAWVDSRDAGGKPSATPMLHWKPPPADGSSPYIISRVIQPNQAQAGNALTLSCERMMSLSKDIRVVVESWHTQLAATVTATTPPSDENKPPAGSTVPPVQSGPHPRNVVMSSTAPTGTGTAANQARIAYAYDYFVAQGWSPYAASGLAAMMQDESGGDPTAVGDLSLGPGQQAEGLFQWRLDRITAFQDMYGVDVTQGTTDQQLAYAQWELTQGPYTHAGNQIAAATSASQAGVLATQLYEIPHDPTGSVAAQRGADAQTLYSQFSGRPAQGADQATLSATPTDKADDATAGGNGEDVTEYRFQRPNLSHDIAQKLADGYYKDISRHEMKISGTLWPDLVLNPHRIVKLTGTGSAWDQIYHPDQVTRQISWGQGFVMRFSARNRATDTDASAGA